ncbi:alpha/beta hydrolase [Nocardiopsis lambiniae]|uniref:Alpha/beta fold hydrolase n=1 Tax=Nocardiopsis lambiniae TaxID=3075539 RepID=A0ABU2MAG2_9ACTN|nr:alpha/beta fold hydrolase [Nocardiopsis sp. DSM 44743]MDT0329589.1 alpha/beta fold hydrolase [Nocardiopsis sp. DSM 44743]
MTTPHPIDLEVLAVTAPRVAGERALRLWSDPGDTPLVDRDRDVHDRARVAHFGHQGWRVATYTWGEGARPVLLVHGWGSRASRMAPLVRALTGAGHTVVSWDAPGHGATGGPAGTVLDALAIARRLQERHGDFAAVVGHSLGGLFATHLVREGVRADRLVLLSAMADFEGTVDGFVTAFGWGPRVNKALRRAIEDAFFTGDRDIWERFATDRDAETLKAPVLLFHDVDDPVISHAESLRVLSAMGAGTRLVSTVGLGHNRILTDPDVLDRITDFLAPVPVGAG